MRRIEQPGLPNPERIQWVEARGRAFSFTLEPGLPLLEAARHGFAAEGFAGGDFGASLGQLNKNNVAQFMLSVIRNADSSFSVHNIDPLMLFRVLVGFWITHAFALL